MNRLSLIVVACVLSTASTARAGGVGPLDVTWLGDLPAPTATVPRHVGKAPRMIGDYPDNLGRFAVDTNGDVFVLDGDRDGPAAELVVEPANGAPRVLARTAPLPNGYTEELFDIAADTSSIYFTTVVRNHDASEVAFALRMLPKSGGPARVLLREKLPARGLVSELFVDGDAAYFLRIADVKPLHPEASIERLAKTAGSRASIAARLGGFYAVASDDNFVYHEKPAPTGGRDLVRVPKRGGPAQVMAHASEYISAIAVDHDYVFYVERTLPRLTIFRLHKRGGRPTRVADYDGFPSALVADHGTVYWTEHGPTLRTPERLHARDAGRPTMGPVRQLAATITRSAIWKVTNHTLYVATSNHVERTPLPRDGAARPR